LGTGYAVGKPFTISYSTLAAASALNPADSDGAYVTFVLTSISNGTIKKGGTTMVAMVGASQANPVTPSANAQLVPGESFVFFPSSATTGSAVTLATVRGWDGLTYSTSEVTLQATFVATTNQIPVITYVKDFTGALKNPATYAFSYDSLRGDPSLMTQGTQRTDAYDSEENIASKSLQFRVKSIAAGSTLARTSPSPYTFTGSGTETIDPSQSFTWTPPVGATGRQLAFSIVAYDGTNEGSNSAGTAIPVYVYVNKDPTFTNSTNIISGIVENTPYTITYDKLFSTFPSSDDSTGILGYQITSVGVSGTLQRYVNGVATSVTAPYTLYPGDQVMWTPSPYASGSYVLFNIRLLDGDGATSAQIAVNGTVASVNTPPTVISATALSSVARNVSGGKSITYQNIFDAVNFREYDVNTSVKPNINDAHGIKFRIESVNAGTLRAVNSSGTVINPTPGDVSTMKYLVQTSPDNTTSWTTLNWTPPTNSVGTYTIMKVRLYDGEDFSDSVVSITAEVTSGNTAPTSSGFTMSPGISEGNAQLITYDNLLSLSGAADTENDLIKFKITWLSSGSFSFNGTTYNSVGAIATPPTVGPGETVTWRPGTNANGLATAAFKMKPTDLTNDGSEVQVNVDVAAVNTAPTNLPTYTYTGATRYPNARFVEISHSSLVTNLSASDVEDATTLLKFKVEELLGGQSVYVQTSGSCGTIPTASSFYPSATTITNGQSYCWVQPSGVIGTYEALRLSVLDNNNAIGSTQARISVGISVGTDSTPAYYGTYVTPTFNVVKANGTKTWTYEQLKNLAGAYDTDSSAISLVITYINPSFVSGSSGTLTKNSLNTTNWSGTLGTAYSSNIPTTAMVIAPGESITYTSFSSGTYATGSTNELFRIAAMDSYSVAATAKSVNVSLVSSTGLNPTFGYVAPIPVATKTNGVEIRVPYLQFRSYADAHDIDEPSILAMRFLITSVTTTNGSVTISKNGAACTAITANTTVLESVDSICFTPNATGAALATDAIHSILQLRTQNYFDNITTGTAINFQIRMP
jgi:hypothetical protein